MSLHPFGPRQIGGVVISLSSKSRAEFFDSRAGSNGFRIMGSSRILDHIVIGLSAMFPENDDSGFCFCFFKQREAAFLLLSPRIIAPRSFDSSLEADSCNSASFASFACFC